jgi:hypothetical protein
MRMREDYSSGVSAELNDAAAVALGGAAFRERGELLHGLSFGGFALTAFFALVGLPVQGLSDRGGATDVRDRQDFDVELGGFVLDAEHVPQMNFACGLGLDFVGADPAKIAGLGCEGTRFEETGGPEPLVDADRLSD